MIFLPLVLLCVGCTQSSNSLNNTLLRKFEVTGSYKNHCSGVDVPMCWRFEKNIYVDKSRKYKMQSMRLIGDMFIKSMLGGWNETFVINDTCNDTTDVSFSMGKILWNEDCDEYDGDRIRKI